MSKIPILNKKYIFLQNVFYQSIQSLKVSNKTIVEKINNTKEKKNSIKNLLLFKTNLQKNNNLNLIETKKNLNFFYSTSKNLTERKENKLNQKNTRKKNLFNQLNQVCVAKSLQRRDLLQKSIKKYNFSGTIERKENLANLKFHQNFSLLTFNKSFLEKQENILPTKQIINFFVPKGLLTINRSLLSCAYKKSFFCYWLLPFMGFVTCIPTMINYPSPKFVFSATQLRYQFNKNFLNNLSLAKNSPNLDKKLNKLELDVEKKKMLNQETNIYYKENKSFLNSNEKDNNCIYFEKSQNVSSEANQVKSSALNDLLNIKKIIKINLKNKRPFLTAHLWTLKKDTVENHNSYFLEDNFDALENSYLKLYDFYNKDLEKILNNPSSLHLCPEICSRDLLGDQTATQPQGQIKNQQNNITAHQVDLNKIMVHRNPRNFYSFSNLNWVPQQLNEPIETFYNNRIYKNHTFNFINEASLKWVWLNSSFSSPEMISGRRDLLGAKLSTDSLLKNYFVDSYTKKESNFAFFKKNSLYCFGQRLEKNTYCLLNNIRFFSCIANQQKQNLNQDLSELRANFSRLQPNRSIFNLIFSDIKSYEKEKIMSTKNNLTPSSLSRDEEIWPNKYVANQKNVIFNKMTPIINNVYNKKMLPAAGFVVVKTELLKNDTLSLNGCYSHENYFLGSKSIHLCPDICQRSVSASAGEEKVNSNLKKVFSLLNSLSHTKLIGIKSITRTEDNQNIELNIIKNELLNKKYDELKDNIDFQNQNYEINKNIKNIKNVSRKNTDENVSFFFEFDQHKYFPKFFSLATDKKSNSYCPNLTQTQNNFYKNPLLSYQIASSFIDKFIGHGSETKAAVCSFSDRENIGLPFISDVRDKAFGHGPQVAKIQQKYSLNQEVLMNLKQKEEFISSSLSDILSSISVFSNKKIKSDFDFCKLSYFELVDMKVKQTKPNINNTVYVANRFYSSPDLWTSRDLAKNRSDQNKPSFHKNELTKLIKKDNNFLEKTIKFLITKQRNINSQIFDSTSSVKSDLVTMQLTDNIKAQPHLWQKIINSPLLNIECSVATQEKFKDLDKGLKKLNKDSLYYIIFDSLKNSLNNLDSNSSKFNLLIDLTSKKKHSEMISGSSTMQLNKNLSILNKSDLNKLFLNNSSFIYPLKIKLTHPILIVNKEISNTKFVPQTSPLKLLIQQVISANLNSKGGNDLTKVIQQNKLFSNNISLNSNLNFGPATLFKKQKISKEKYFSNPNNKNLKKNNYSHFSKYLNFLSTKIKKVLFNPTKVNFKENLQDSPAMKISASRSLDDLHEQEKNQTLNSSKISPFSVKKLYKTHNRRTATATEEKSQKRVNKFDTNENLIKSNSATGAAAEQSNRIVSKRRNINFTLKKNNLNIIKDRFSWVVSSSVHKKQKNSYPFIPVSILKTKKTRTINSQMGRLEKIFRSYLSKKRNFENDEQLKPNKLKKQKSNFPQIQSSAVAVKNFGLITTQLSETLKKNDPNVLILNNKKIKISKKKALLNHKNVNPRFYNLSPTLFFKNRMVILKTRTKKLTSKEKNLIKPSNWYIKSNNFLRFQTIKDNLLLNKNPFSIWVAPSSSPEMSRDVELNHLEIKNDLKLNNQPLLSPLKTKNEKAYFSLLEKRKYDRKKRRRKKQRKETRRRKKRKRFYPRPTWIRFKLYNKFLKIRHLKFKLNKEMSIFRDEKVLFISRSAAEMKRSYTNRSLEKEANLVSSSSSSSINRDLPGIAKKKIYRNYKQNWSSIDIGKQNLFNLSQLEKNHQILQLRNNQTSQIFQNRGKVLKTPSGLNCLDSTYFSFFSNKDFYQISRTVLGDLKRIFWKSYWLRSNLNPYLNRVKTYLNEMKNSTKSWQLYLNIQNLNDFIFGLTNSFREIPEQVNFGLLNKPIGYTSSFSNSRKTSYFLTEKEENNFFISATGRSLDISGDGEIYSNKNLMHRDEARDKDGGYINIKNYLQSCYLSSSSNNWQVAINIAEYQRIVYERIQQTILNIRENLNINGQTKARSSKIGRQRLQTPKPVKDFWIKFGKAITLEIPNNLPINFYGDLAKLRVHWSLNKSNVGSFKTINKRKNLWISQKLREQKKSNKTKKIVSQMVNLLTNILNEKPTFSNSYENHLGNQPLLKSLTKKPFFNKFTLDNPDSHRDKIDQTILLSSFSLAVNSNSLSSTKLIKKLVDLNVENPAEKNLEKLKHSLIMSEQKLRKKENKLLYLGFFTKKTNKLSLQKNYLRSLKKELQEVPLIRKNNFKSIYLNTNSFNKLTNRGTVESNHWYNFNTTQALTGIIPPFKNKLNIFDNNSILLWTSTFLFHFCAFISFINFSEVRGLIKFYVILFSKIFKSYLDIIFSISYNFYNLFSSVTSFNSINLEKNLKTEPIKMTARSSRDLLDKVTRNFIKLQKHNFLTNFLISTSVPFFKLARGNVEVHQLKENYLKELLNKTSFWQRSNFSKKIYLNSNRGAGIKNQRDTIINFNKTVQLAIESKNVQFNWQRSTGLPLKTKKHSISMINPNPTKRVFFGQIIQRSAGSRRKDLKRDLLQFVNLNSSNSITKEFSEPFKNNFSNRYSWAFYFGQKFVGWLNQSEIYSKSLELNQIKPYNFKSYIDLLPNLIYFSFLNLVVKIFLNLNIKKSKNKIIKVNGAALLSQLEKDNLLKSDVQITFVSSKGSNFFKIIILSFLKTTISSSFKGSFSLYTSLIRSLDIFQVILSSIYSFFEKPGELIVDWIAYAFLVEWSSDLTTNIPDVLDSTVMNSFFKTSRIIRPLIISQVFLLSNPLMISNSLIQRRIWHSYQMIIEQFCQPDSDLIIRHKKGMIFWDIWSELLIDVAEDSNINISELTSLKEEQNRLLDKLELYASQKNNNNRNVSLLGKTNGSQQIIQRSAGRSVPDLWKSSKSPTKKLNKINLKNALKINSLSKSNINPYTELQSNQNTNRLYTWFGFNFKKPYSFAARSSSREDLLGEMESKKLMLGINHKMLSTNKNMFLTRKQIINQTETTWSANQFLSYQGKDTELFIDLHPPKSFLHIPSIKFSQSVQQPIGTVICQVFAGIFNQQIAKNILVVGSSGVEKSLLIQALAGETELKIITDNANRYAMIYRGVAIGIKLLRDVFEALSLHTPCVFLLEDIHHIGERRPFLISDDENSKATEFGSEKEEIHEKNQVIYQLSKHFVSHYKKPYKGDFSLLIPTNHFCFNLFLGVSSPRTRGFNITPASPINLDKLGVDPSQSNILDSLENKKNLRRSSSSAVQGNLLSSSLQIQSNQLLAPPATSPFSVLVLKEEKKLKPKQIVKEMPWSGLPGEQLALISKSNYSIRVKIALLADMALSNVSVKLDMITDLLVIIDSVKGNRGFIVFATTHVPYILDPALRRPGRFDETISLPLIPNLFSRWEILKANFVSATEASLYSFFPKGLTVDFTNISGIFSPTFGLLKLNDKLVNFNNQLYQQILSPSNQILSPKGHRYLTMTYHLATKQEPLINPSKIQQYSNLSKLSNIKFTLEKNISNKTNFQEQFIKGNSLVSKKKRYIKLNSLNIETLTKNEPIKQRSTKTFFNLIARTYFYVSRILTYISTTAEAEEENSLKTLIPSTSAQKFAAQKFKSQNNQLSRLKKLTIPPTDLMLFENNVYLSLYASTKTLKQHLTNLMAGKLGELFAFSNYQRITNYQLEQKSSLSSSNSINVNFDGNEGLISLYGIDKTWRSASSLLFSVLSKRYLLNKNLMTPKLLYFSNHSSLHESPSPPASNILLPLKRYENYKRTFNIEQIKHKANSPIKNLHSTLELHQQQRLVKRLYKLPIREFFRSEIISEKLVGFANSSITLASIEKNTIKPSSMNWYYRHRILNRHRNYLNTQWWNGQLNEHNTESTFSSDIDWRYTFVESIGDIFIDFPDSEQFYNARNRRWSLTSGSWNNWFNFSEANQQITLHQIYNQYIFDCFIKTYTSLDQSREILDFYAFTSLNHCMLKELKEISIINIFNRFSKIN